MDNDSAYILVSTLFVTAFLGLLFSTITMQQHYAVTSRYEEIHTLRALERAKQGISESIKLSPAGLRQIELRGRSGKMETSLSVHQFLSSKSYFPDFNMLSRHFVTCRDKNDFSANHTQSGERITPSSFLSPESCINITLSKEDEQIYFYLENIEIQALLASESVIITSTGFINIQNLKMESDTSLFAAGDIVIDLVEAAETGTLSLYSASGIIYIKSLSQKVKLKAYAAEGIYLPAGHSAPEPLTSGPYLKDSLVLGLR